VSAAERPTRLVFADTLTAGQTVLLNCTGWNCPLGGHGGETRAHELTILDMRTEPQMVAAIVVDAATGEQAMLNYANTEGVRIYADPEVRRER
jgi:hypothetical protein